MNIYLYIHLTFVIIDLHNFSLPYHVYTPVWHICHVHPNGRGIIMELEGWFLCQLIALIKLFMNIYLYTHSTFVVFDLHNFSLPYHVYTPVWHICPVHPNGRGLIMELEGWFLCQLIALIKPFMNIYLCIQSTFLIFYLHIDNFSFMVTVTLPCIHTSMAHMPCSPQWKRE